MTWSLQETHMRMSLRVSMPTYLSNEEQLCRLRMNRPTQRLFLPSLHQVLPMHLVLTPTLLRLKFNKSMSILHTRSRFQPRENRHTEMHEPYDLCKFRQQEVILSWPGVYKYQLVFRRGAKDALRMVG
jgi:hypothetical protein